MPEKSSTRLSSTPGMGSSKKNSSKSTRLADEDRRSETKVVLEDSSGEDESDENHELSRRGKRSKKNGKGQMPKRAKKSLTPKVQRCPYCKVPETSPDVRFYQGHPEGATEEDIALCSQSLIPEDDDIAQNQILYDEESIVNRPSYRLLDYTLYDEASHLVSLDAGLIERNGNLWASGYIKTITDDSEDIEGAVPVCEMGPLESWWITGFDFGPKAVLGFSTGAADYYLVNPSEVFKSTIADLIRKVFVTKLVVERLLEAGDTMENLEYEDLLRALESRNVPGQESSPISADDLIKYSDFVVAQVFSYEEAGDDDEDTFMMDAPCIREIIDLSGLKRNKVKKIGSGCGRVRREPGAADKAKKALFSKATTTPLIRFVFESFFKDQIADASPNKPQGDDDKKKGGHRKKRCGMCDGCLAPDCGECTHCKDMCRFGGKGKGKQACLKRRCENVIEVIDALMEVEADEECDDKENKKRSRSLSGKSSKLPSKADFFKPRSQKTDGVAWGEKLGQENGISYYSEVDVDGETYRPGDFAFVSYNDSGIFLRKISFLFEKKGKMLVHLQRYEKGTDTLLADAADEKEAFQVLYCDQNNVSSLVGKASVIYWPPPTQEEWLKQGGTMEATEGPPNFDRDNGQAFFYRMRCDNETARFEHALNLKAIKDTGKLDFCPLCESEPMKAIKRKGEMKALNPIEESEARDLLTFRSFMVLGRKFDVGDAIFFTGGTSAAPRCRREDDELERRKAEVDEERYPEFYRKTARVKGSNESLPKPFAIGIVEEINAPREGKGNIRLKVRKMYRPESTCLKPEEAFSKDLNLVYWSDDLTNVELPQVRGKCFLQCETSLTDGLKAWTDSGEFRFYYNMAYDKASKTIKPLPAAALKYKASTNSHMKGNGKGKGKKSSASWERLAKEDPTMGAYPELPQKLKCLDVFAGCGGLSLGLHQAGVAESRWAIEVFEPAANAYKLNNAKCDVFTDDCNQLLALVIAGHEKTEKGQRLPAKGEVELLCGGPPCQGFSGMNRFNYREYSSFKNSLIASYLSYCDFYRPRYFMLENVRNFVTFKKSAVLRLCMKALLKMGYACTFAILQAGHFGVAQTRRRAILMAAAPGEELPLYPEPKHVFATTPLSAQIGDTVCISNCNWTTSAPYRTVTVRDTLSDLPELSNADGSAKLDRPKAYDGFPRSHFQRIMREGVSTDVRDHVCKEMSALVEARMEFIPTLPGSDWRDLPNIVHRLKDGAYTDKLVYKYNDYLRGKAEDGSLRGVCFCATGKGRPCRPEDKQTNTLIPWCLPHTSARHNQWSGLYGRLEYDGFFSTTVTNPEPMGKQGRVLHPEQHRLVSVRECARSQGFPDWYQFHGTVLDRHRQVGNAVSPPMGLALGLEIRKAAAKGRRTLPKNEVMEEAMK